MHVSEVPTKGKKDIVAFFQCKENVKCLVHDSVQNSSAFRRKVSEYAEVKLHLVLKKNGESVIQFTEIQTEIGL
jgi:hypothetical protein